METPTYVCQPPIEDTLTLSPVLPISLDFGMDTLDQFHDYPNSGELIDHSCDPAVETVLSEPEKDTEIVKCPNCDEKMEEWNHVCEIQSDVSESVEVVNEKEDDTQKEEIYEYVERAFQKLRERLIDKHSLNLPP